MMVLLGKLLGAYDDPESQGSDSNMDVQREVVIEQSSDVSSDEMVWNEYRQTYTDQETLAADESWDNQSSE